MIQAATIVLIAAMFMTDNLSVPNVHASAERKVDLLLVVNKEDHTLSIVDPESGQQLAAVPVGGVTGHEVAAAPDGKTAWVPIYGNSGVGQPGTDGRSIAVIDLKSRSRVADLDLGAPSRPHCPVFGPKDKKLYVTAEVKRSIEVIDPDARKVVDSIPTAAPESHMLVISGDGQRGYTSNVGAGSVSVIDLHSKKVMAVIAVAKVVQRIAISPDDRWVVTADQNKPQLAVIDTHTNTVTTWVTIPSIAYGMTPTRDGRHLLMTHLATNSISVLNLQSMKIERTIPVPATPQEILVRPDDQVAYVSCDRSKQVVAISLASWKVEKTISAGAGADGLGWASYEE